MNAIEETNTEATFSDRRLRRSESFSVALRYQLDVACGEYGVTHMALASGDGFVLASSGNDDAAIWLAAQSPEADVDTILPVVGDGGYLIEPPAVLSGGAMVVEGVEIDGISMLLVGSSRGGTRLKEGISHASRGVERIFDQLWTV